MIQKLEDSGERRQFSTGAVRDRGGLKPRPDLISPHAQLREGMIHTLGSEKYELRNWEQGMPISECLASAQRHIEQYKRGDTNEDHIAQARWNLGAIIHFEEEIKAGRMDPSLDDMPKYAEPLPPCPRCGDVMVPVYCAETGAECYCDACGLTSLDAWPSKQTEARILKELEKKAWKVPYLPPTKKKEPPCQSEATSALSLIEYSDQGYLFRVPREPTSVEPPTFYVAGPMRGYKNLNFDAFDEAAKRGRKLGYNIISPADMDREHGIDPAKDPAVAEHENELSSTELQKIIRRDIEVIMSLQPERGDGVAVLNGWGDSTGATAEVRLAQWLGLRIVDTIDWLNIKVDE